MTKVLDFKETGLLGKCCKIKYLIFPLVLWLGSNKGYEKVSPMKPCRKNVEHSRAPFPVLLASTYFSESSFQLLTRREKKNGPYRRRSKKQRKWHQIL